MRVADDLSVQRQGDRAGIYLGEDCCSPCVHSVRLPRIGVGWLQSQVTVPSAASEMSGHGPRSVEPLAEACEAGRAGKVQGDARQRAARHRSTRSLPMATADRSTSAQYASVCLEVYELRLDRHDHAARHDAAASCSTYVAATGAALTRGLGPKAVLRAVHQWSVASSDRRCLPRVGSLACAVSRARSQDAYVSRGIDTPFRFTYRPAPREGEGISDAVPFRVGSCS